MLNPYSNIFWKPEEKNSNYGAIQFKRPINNFAILTAKLS